MITFFPFLSQYLFFFSSRGETCRDRDLSVTCKMTLDRLINFKEPEFPHSVNEWINWYDRMENTLKSVSHHAVQSIAQHRGLLGVSLETLDPFGQGCWIRGRTDSIRWDSDTTRESCLETGQALRRGIPSPLTHVVGGTGLPSGPDLFPFALPSSNPDLAPSGPSCPRIH